MPTAPKYDSLRVPPKPLDSPGLRGPAATPQSEGVERFEAIARFGETAARLGTQLVSAVMQNERDRADATAITAAERQLGDLESLLLRNPETGALTTVKGKDAAGLHNKVALAFEEQTGMIAGNLTTDRQRLAFERMKTDRWRAMSVAIDQHTVKEMDDYEDGEARAGLDTSLRIAVENFDNPLRVRAELDRQAVIVAEHAKALGLKGEEAQKAFLLEWSTKTHEGVIFRLLGAGQDLRAQEYFAAVKGAGQIAGDALPRLEERLSNGSSAIAGLRAANEIWNTRGPKDDDDAIEIDKMEADARERFATDPKTLEQTIAQLRQRKQSTDAGRKERDDKRLSDIWGAVMQGKPLAAIVTSEAFLDAPGRVQIQLRDYFQRQAEHAANLAYQAEARGAARESRAYTAAQRRDKEIEIEGWSKYWELSDPAVLSKMTRGELMAQLPTLGRAHVERLINDQEQLLRTAGAVRAATIDDATFKEIAQSAGFDYAFKASPSSTQRATLGTLKAAVLAEIAREQSATNKPLTLERKREIMQGIVDRKVMLKDWVFDDESIAALVPADRQKAAYVPIASVPRDVITQAIGELRKIAPGVPDAELQRRYQNRIERAYGARLVGRTRAEIEAILKGAQ